MPSSNHIPVYIQNQLGDLLGSYAYLDGILTPGQQPHFNPRKTGRSAEYHTEPKVMEEVAFILDGLISRYDEFEIKAVLKDFHLTFYTRLYPCKSCRNVIGEFLNLYGNIFGDVEHLASLIEIYYGDPLDIQHISPYELIKWSDGKVEN